MYFLIDFENVKALGCVEQNIFSQQILCLFFTAKMHS